MVNMPLEEVWARAHEFIDSRKHIIPLIISGEKILDEEGRQVYTVYWSPSPAKAAARAEVFGGISDQTYLNWLNDEKSEYHDVVKWLDLEIEAYLEDRLNTAKQVDGVKFNLTNNYRQRWKERQELELGPETRASEALTAISLRDKLTLIIQASEKAKRTMLTHPDPEEGEDNAEPDDKD